MIKCGLDLGGSTVRYGISQECITKFSAKVLEIELSSMTKDYASDDPLTDFIIREHPLSRLCNRRFVRNEAIDQYRGNLLFCDNQEVKVRQDITYINAAYAIAADCVKQYYEDQEVVITACIPTSEYFSEGTLVQEFKDNLTGHYTIEFPRTKQQVSFNVSPGNVRVVPEGVVAVFKYGKQPKFREGVTLVIDVGHRSTDITLLKNFKPMGNSAVSRPKGGMNIIASVRSSLERNNILLSAEEIEEALSHRYCVKDDQLVDVTDLVNLSDCDTEKLKALLLDNYSTMVTAKDVDDALNKYYVRQADGVLDLTPYVTEAKKMFAASIKVDITEVLSLVMMNLSSVNTVAPIGRIFIGEQSSNDNMVRILMDTLFNTGTNTSRAAVCCNGNLADANIIEIMKLIDAEA